MSNWARLGTSIALGAASGVLMYLGLIVVVLLNGIIPIWPFAAISATIAAFLFAVDLVTEVRAK